MTVTIDCETRTTREINLALREAAREQSAVVLRRPDCRHNLAVGVTAPLSVEIDGHVGYYCGGLCDGVDIRVAGDAGWGLGENLMGGRIAVSGSAGSAAGATMRGGTVIVGGDAGARCGIAMKGGTLIVGGSVGVLSAFMMQKGVLIVGGDAGEGIGDSLYEGKIYVRGAVASLGSDAVIVDQTPEDAAMLTAALLDAGIDAKPEEFKKIVSGKKLYNFSTKEKEIWKTAL